MSTASPGFALGDDRLRFATGLVVSFVRTTRVPEDGREYPLTAHHGEFPLRAAAAHPHAVPGEWIDRNEIVAPAYEGEAFFAAFEGREPHAVQVEARGRNVLSGEPAGAPLRAEPQSYVVCPPQQWLDGFYEGQRRVRQFTVVIEAGEGEGSGLTLRVFPPRAAARQKQPAGSTDVLHAPESMEPFEWGVGKGGVMDQPIVRDPLGLESWDRDRVVEVRIHLVDAIRFARMTGEPPLPPPPVPPTYR